MRWKVTPQAAKDLDEIFQHTLATWGGVQALKYLDDLESKFGLIASFPGIGRPILKTKHSRKIEHDSHVIVFRQTRTGISIQRVIHERRMPDYRYLT